MAEKSVITNIENRIRQLMDDHKRLSDQCAELTAQRDSLKAENRTLQERIRELDGELSRMQLTEAVTGTKRGPASTVLCGRWTSASRCSEGPNRQRPQREEHHRYGRGYGRPQDAQEAARKTKREQWHNRR